MECKDLDVLCSGSELLIALHFFVRVSINANFKIPPMRHGGSRKGLHMNGTIRTVRNEQGGGEGFPTEVEVVRVPSPNEGALSVAEDVLLQEEIREKWVALCYLVHRSFEKILKNEHRVIKLTQTTFCLKYEGLNALKSIVLVQSRQSIPASRLTLLLHQGRWPLGGKLGDGRATGLFDEHAEPPVTFE